VGTSAARFFDASAPKARRTVFKNHFSMARSRAHRSPSQAAKSTLSQRRQNPKRNFEDGTCPDPRETFLYRLPEELVLAIMEYLTPVDLFCLRRASALFLRLFSAAAFSSLHRQPPMELKTRHAMQLTPDGEVWAAMWNRLREDCVYCQECRHTRASQGFQQRYNALIQQDLHCSLCYCHHPAILFSAEQRKKAPASESALDMRAMYDFANTRHRV
jgi:hypothetical protein